MGFKQYRRVEVSSDFEYCLTYSVYKVRPIHRVYESFMKVYHVLFVLIITSTSQIVVEKKLDVFLQEFQDGMHEGSVISTQTVESLSTDERQAWRAIRKELEDIGISVAAFDANKTFIINWFKTAMSTGAFEEKSSEDNSGSVSCENNLGPSSEDLEHGPVSRRFF